MGSFFHSRYCSDFHSIWWAAISTHAIVVAFHSIVKAAILKKATHPQRQPFPLTLHGAFTLRAGISTRYCRWLAIYIDSHFRSRYCGPFTLLWRHPPSTHAFHLWIRAESHSKCNPHAIKKFALICQYKSSKCVQIYSIIFLLKRV